MTTPPTVIIGAGVAGLIAAIELQRAGQSVVVCEASPDVGGRVRTTVRDGFRLDHGFQVLFTAYPVLGHYLDQRALDLRSFRPAARLVRDNGRTALVGDALADPSLLVPSLTGGALGTADLWRVLRLKTFATSLSVDECFAPRFASVSTRTFLQQHGLSEQAIREFFAPFYGGILLDRSLDTRASVLLFTFQMLARGRTSVPSRGMGAIPRQLQAQLTPGTVLTGARVRALAAADERLHSVILDDGTELAASHVVLATDVPSARVLAASLRMSLNEPAAGLGCTTVYYAADRAPLPGRALWLNARRDAVVSHAVTVTEVAPEYAPPGQHLLSATLLGEHAELPADALDRAVRDDLALMARIGGVDPLPELTHLGTWRIPFAQFAQPPVSAEVAHSASEAHDAHDQSVRAGRLPTGRMGDARTNIANLWRASEVLHSSSLDGAARGGRLAAHAVLSSAHTS